MNIKSNIWKIYAIQVLRWFMLSIPIIVLFYQSHGLNMRQVLLLQALFSIIIVGAEIPTGYFADKFGRKKSIILGCIAGFLGYGIYSLSSSFLGFALAETLLGISGSFISGADSALLYDTFLSLNREKEYQSAEGKKLFWESGSEALASVLGGLLAVLSLKLPFIVQSAVLLFSIPLAFSLVEVKIAANDVAEEFTSMRQIVGFSLLRNHQVKWLIFYYSFVAGSTLSVIWFIQPYLSQIGFTLVSIGFIWAFFQLFTAIVSYHAYRLERNFGRKLSLLMLLPLSVLGYILVGIQAGIWSAAAFLFFYFVRSISTPVIKDYLNRLISSNIRATVLSIKNMGARVVFALIGPLLGWANDLYSFQTAMFLAATIFGILFVISFFFLTKHKILIA